jgi:tetratricopeptide (TPR) repeat protein
MALAACLLLPAVTVAQQASVNADSLMGVANGFLQSGSWQQAADLYKQVVAADTSNIQAQFFLGQCEYRLGNYAAAEQAWEVADSAGYRQQTTRYNLAVTSIKLGKIEAAFTWLAQALKSGFDRVDILKSDPDLDTLRSDDRWPAVVKRADQNARPCVYEPVFQILDFWVGEWDVYVSTDQKVGHSVIHKKVDDCLLEEDYTQQDGFVSETIMYYEPYADEWRMLWITGNPIALGGIKEKVLTAVYDKGSMRFQGQLPAPEGGKYLDRTTITPQGNDRINMTVEQSHDGGNSWDTTFRGYYKRVKKAQQTGSDK